MSISSYLASFRYSSDSFDTIHRLKSKPKNLLDEQLLQEASFLDSVINFLDQTLEEGRVVTLVSLNLEPTDGQHNLNDRRRLEISALSDEFERTEILPPSPSDLLVLSPTSKRPRPKLPDHLLLSTPSLSFPEVPMSLKLPLPLLDDRNSTSNPERNLSMVRKVRRKRTLRTLKTVKVRMMRTKMTVLSTPTLLR